MATIEPTATIRYGDSTIVNLFNGQTATLKCEGMEMEDDVVVQTMENGGSGASGVHVGTDAPPENANIWINPEGEPTSTEDWEFDLDSGTTDTKKVVVLDSDEATANGRLAILKIKDNNGNWVEIPALIGSRGAPGASGVHIGTGTPPANANIWINPEGDPTSTENWEFDLDDGNTDTKKVVVLDSDESTANGKLAILRMKDDNGNWVEIPALVGSKGEKGDPGYTPRKGIDYFDGKDGGSGANGVSCTHSWSGTTLTITSASGTSSADLKGGKGDPYTLTDTDKNSIAAAVKNSLTKENWTFTLENGSTVTKAVYVG